MLGSKAARLSAMLPEEPEAYVGTFVILEAVPNAFRVRLQPPLNGENKSRTFPMKDDAWFYARELWSAHRLPLKDFTDRTTGRESHNRSSVFN
jgi:hypothetical protein